MSRRRTELPRLLGLDGNVTSVVLDALATVLTDGGVFDGLTASDAIRVAGTLAWQTLLHYPVPSAEDASDKAAIRAVRCKAGFDGLEWEDRAAVAHAYFLAAEVLLHTQSA